MAIITKLHQQRCRELERQKREGETQAEESVVIRSAGIIPNANEHTTLLVALEQDLDRLSTRKKVEEKIALKRDELLPKYVPKVMAYLESGALHSNPLLVWCAIWAIDADDLEVALPLCDAAIEQQQNAPAHFKRDLPTYFTEAISDWAERQYKAGQSASPYIDEVCQRVTSNTWPVAQVIARGKPFRIAGMIAEQHGELPEALAFYRQAQEENERAGVKTRLDKLAAKLGENAKPEGNAEPADSDAADAAE
ncbi:terminase [Pseudomaricurvus alkylphenolicus]|uniref:phage terminase small subunit n=1 Tax=Pseudomaricurvus alkylphenolicus TaxID=1306991 RepID=UPI001420F961|nr:phage terminase small subunit [Pseudomaricurvus alkylphenolicus]NIB44782.1 terminase [Pseudomaricurvus alkylphenolicus]